VEAIVALEYPKTIKQAQEVIGSFNYYREFIKNYAEIAEPLTSGMATKHIRRESNNKVPTSTTPYPDTPEMRKAFQQLKDALSTAPVLIHPDFNRGFTLYTDAYRKGIARALHQISADDKKEYPVLFISCTLKPAEKNYSSTEIECLAIVWCLYKLEHYVDGVRLTLYTDHSALKWI
jgi:hypothetical protein